ncbi:MAG: hypothetical protein A2Z07_05320 [Armatimonadetes bacterium RBG_16_67_12]|nr:MAG: hypothetical protein A2Z07_05320 [Armatimonadetes bacterium RBG_16_67_12]
MGSVPTGTVTFLFTDIEGSTPLLEHLGDEAYARLLAEHRRLLREAFAAAHGHEVETQGDGFLVAFQSARDAVASALNAQRALAAYPWPDGAAFRVRMGLHTGEPQVSAGGYTGLDLHRVARICQAGWGGQILLSQATRDLIAGGLPEGAGLADLGARRLRGVHHEERMYQLLHADLPADFPPLRTLDSLPNNLPRQLTSFIGRAREMDEVEQLLSANRLVTLTGSGGCGKTRLAVQVAGDRADVYPDGVWLVELAPLSEPVLVPQATASALRVREQPGRPLLVTLAEHLQMKHALVVLDNCEHLVGACAHLAETLLRGCPDVRIRATSRERLGVAGEVVSRVPSLTVPDLARLPAFEVLARSEAVRLFGERAVAAWPGFRVTHDNAPLVAHICQRLDGIPLAIELAAARVNVLSLDQIALRLNDRFRLLVGGSRTAPSRQQTLRAALDWSYVLLAERERALLGRLSVFAGGWTLDAAEAICAGEGIGPGDVLDLLTLLIDKSLVIVDEREGDLRYRLLETVRQYVRDRLLETGQEAAVRARHRDWFLEMAEQAEAELRGPAQAAWLKRLDAEHDNVRSILEWTLANVDSAESALRLAAAMGRFWWMRGYLSEGRRWLEEAVAFPGGGSDTSRGQALLEAGRLAWAQSDYAAAGALLEQSLALFRSLEDKAGIADALNMLGLVAWVQSDYNLAQARYQEALALSREMGDRRRIGTLLNNLGRTASDWGAYALADGLHREDLEIRRSLGDEHGVATSLHNLGLVALGRGDLSSAHGLFEEGRRIREALGDKHNLVYSLNALGLVAYRQSEFHKAAALCEESLAFSRALGNREGISNALINLARLALRQGDVAQAKARCRESLALRKELGDRRGIAECLERLAEVAHADGHSVRAGRLLGATAAMREHAGAYLTEAERSDWERIKTAIVTSLGERGDTAVQEGQALSPERVIELALGDEP